MQFFRRGGYPFVLLLIALVLVSMSYSGVFAEVNGGDTAISESQQQSVNPAEPNTTAIPLDDIIIAEEPNEDLVDGGIVNNETLKNNDSYIIQLDNNLTFANETTNAINTTGANNTTIINDNNSTANSSSSTGSAGSNTGNSGGGGGSGEKATVCLFNCSSIPDAVNLSDAFKDFVALSGNSLGLNIENLTNNSNETQDTNSNPDQLIFNQKRYEINLTDAWVLYFNLSSNQITNDSFSVYIDIIEKNLTVLSYILKDNKEILLLGDGFYDISYLDRNSNGFSDQLKLTVPNITEELAFKFLINLTEGAEYASIEAEENISILNFSAPSGTTSISPVHFEFEVNFSSLVLPYCNLSINAINLSKNYKYSLPASNFSSIDLVIENGDYNWTIYCFDKNGLNASDFNNGSFVLAANYTPSISFYYVNYSTTTNNRSILFYIHINGNVNQTMYYTLDYGDGQSVSSGDARYLKNLDSYLWHNYANFGVFNSSLTVISTQFGVKTYNKELRVSLFETQNYSNNKTDKKSPNINLIYPNENARLSNETISFLYYAEDDIKISNCTFSLYYYVNGSDFGKMLYNETEQSGSNSSNFTSVLRSFQEGKYTWEVECTDNSSNSYSKYRSFEYILPYVSNISYSISTLNESYENKDEIEDLLNRINSINDKVSGMNSEQQEALKDMGLVDNLAFYKKKALQLKLDFQNYKDFVGDVNAREKRKQEMKNELANIEVSVPSEIKILEQYEYMKNSISGDISSILKSYFDIWSKEVRKKVLSSLGKEVIEFQKQTSIRSKVTSIEISYSGRTERFVLVSKTIDSKNTTYDQILEYIPQTIVGLNEVSIIGEHKRGNSDLIVFNVASGGTQKIKYIINRTITLKDVELSDSLIVNSSSMSNLNFIESPTGFSIFNGSAKLSGFWTVISWVLIIGVLIILIIAGKNTRIRLLAGKDPVSKPISEKLREIKQFIEDKDYDSAKRTYRELSTLYSRANKYCRKHYFKRIHNLQVAIDRKELHNLTRECIELIKNNKIEDARRMYNHIQMIYNKVSKKDKDKAFVRLKPYIPLLTKLAIKSSN